jgi:hypothetical protein
MSPRVIPHRQATTLEDERDNPQTELTVRALRWILAHADAELTLAEAISAAADAERAEAQAAEHADLQRDYDAYLTRRRGREQELVQAAYVDAREYAVRARGGAISVAGAHQAGQEQVDLERLRFEVHEPALSFEAWLEAGQPDVHRTGGAPRDPKAKLEDQVTGP